MTETVIGALTDEQMVTLAAELAAEPREPGLSGVIHDAVAIIGGSHDQATFRATENPFWEIVRRVPAEPSYWTKRLEPDGHWAFFDRETMRRAYAAGLDRSSLCVRYSWSIPSPGDIRWIGEQLAGQSVVEIGAGSGYWAWQLRQAGTQVTAYDPHRPSPENPFVKHRTYIDVIEGDHTAAARHPEAALMLCWPSYGATFATRALAAYRGSTVIYIGEGEGGCCAEDEFHQALERDFEPGGVSPFHVTWPGIHCNLTVWRRKAATGE